MRPGTLAELRQAYFTGAEKGFRRLSVLLSRLDSSQADRGSLAQLRRGFEAIGRPARAHGLPNIHKVALEVAREIGEVGDYGVLTRLHLDRWAHRVAELRSDLHATPPAPASISVTGDLLFITERRALPLFASVPMEARGICHLARPGEAKERLSKGDYVAVVVDLDAPGARESVLRWAGSGVSRMIGVSSHAGDERQPAFESVIPRSAEWPELVTAVLRAGRARRLGAPSRSEADPGVNVSELPVVDVYGLTTEMEDAPVQPPPEPTDQPWPPIGRAPRVLVADDDDAVVKLLEYYLGYAGWEVEHASDGQRAAAALAGGEFDLALVDLAMPHWTGFQLLEWLSEHAHRRPRWVHVITAQSHEAAKARAYALGADDFVPKPFDPVALVERLREPGSLP